MPDCKRVPSAECTSTTTHMLLVAAAVPTVAHMLLIRHMHVAAAAALPQVTEVPPFSAEANAVLEALAANFSVADAQEVRRGSRQQQLCSVSRSRVT